MTVNVAIDGPSGAGKSTMARHAAALLGYVYVDTGALYRAVGLAVRRKGADPADAAAVEPLLPSIRLSFAIRDGVQRVFLGDEDVSDAIRTPEAGLDASQVSALPCVRDFLLDTQREIAAKENVIMDGRDIGTVVLPDAQVKIYLTASAEARALRRYREQVEKGVEQPYEAVLEELKQRDDRDMHREIAPLRQAEDAVLLDSTHLTLEETEEALLALIRKELSHAV